MNADSINEIVRDVFGRNYRTEVVAGWVRMQCPLSTWTHASGRDSKPSAGISIHPTDTSIFNCFTCGNKRPIQDMLRKYAGYTGDDLDSLIEELEEESYLGVRNLPTWDEAKARNHVEPLVELDKAIFLDLYEPAAGHPYLVSRGISDDTADLLQLMIDPSDPADGEERILFPVFGLDGTLHGFSGRATSKTARLKVRDYHGLSKARCLLGAHLIGSTKPDKVLVVEGLFDYANAWQCGQPAVAVMHSTLTEFQAAILREISLPVYDFYDDDEAGRKGGLALGNQLSSYVPVMRTRYPDVWVEDDSPEGSHRVKDPGELLAEEFQAMIDDYRLF